MPTTRFAEEVRDLLRRQGMSQRALAGEIPVDVSHLSRVLNGERPVTAQLARRCEEILEAPGILESVLSAELGVVPQPPAEPARIWNIVPATWGFVGREHELEALHGRLHGGSTAGARVRTAVITGIPGIGKTQLARAFADEHSSDYRIGWWVTAETPLEARAGLNELAVRLGAVETWTPQEVLAFLFDVLAEREDWLLVLDNVTEPSLVEEFLPRRCSGVGHVLITSRSPSWNALGSPLPLAALAVDVAAEVLIAGHGGSDRQAAIDLAHELGCLPLALRQAAAYTAQTGVEITDYLTMFRRERTRLLDCGNVPSYGSSTAAAITLSTDQLASVSPLAHRALEVCSLYAGDVLPLRDIVHALAGQLPEEVDEVQTWAVLGALRQCGLLTLDSSNDVRLHRLTRAVVQERILDLPARVTDALSVMSALFPTVPSEPRSWPRCARLTPHARATLDRALDFGLVSESLASVLTRVGRYLLCTGLDFAAARQLHTAALEQRQALSPGDNPETARALVHLAVDLNELGETAQARDLHEKGLAMRRRLYAEDHPSTAHSLDNLANVLHRLGDHERARDLHEESLVMRQHLHPGDHPDVAYSMSNLAADLRALGAPREAKALDEHALSMRERLDLGDHPDIAHSLSNLAADLHALGDDHAAADLEARSLDIRMRLYPAGHPETTACLARLTARRRSRPEASNHLSTTDDPDGKVDKQ